MKIDTEDVMWRFEADPVKMLCLETGGQQNSGQRLCSLRKIMDAPAVVSVYLFTGMEPFTYLHFDFVYDLRIIFLWMKLHLHKQQFIDPCA